MTSCKPEAYMNGGGAYIPSAGWGQERVHVTGFNILP